VRELLVLNQKSIDRKKKLYSNLMGFLLAEVQL